MQRAGYGKFLGTLLLATGVAAACGGVDDGVRPRHPLPHRDAVGDVPRTEGHARLDQRPGAGVGADERPDLVPLGPQPAAERAPDVARPSGDEEPHFPRSAAPGNPARSLLR